MTKKDSAPYLLFFCFLFVALSTGFHADETDASGSAFTKIDQALARSVVDRIVLDVERLRGLKFKDPVPVSVVNDDQAIAQHMRRMEEFGELDDIRSAEIVMKVLGMANPDDDGTSQQLVQK